MGEDIGCQRFRRVCQVLVGKRAFLAGVLGEEQGHDGPAAAVGHDLQGQLGAGYIAGMKLVGRPIRFMPLRKGRRPVDVQLFRAVQPAGIDGSLGRFLRVAGHDADQGRLPPWLAGKLRRRRIAPADGHVDDALLDQRGKFDGVLRMDVEVHAGRMGQQAGIQGGKDVIV